MEKNHVSIIIVNWNGKVYLEKCLSSLVKQEYKSVEVILVDNNSCDGSVEFVRKKFPHTQIITNTKNLGFAEANNVGYKKARGEYILFLNNDTVVSKSFITKLVEVVNSDEKIGGVQSKILLMDNPNHYDTVGAFLTGTGILYHYGTNQKVSPKMDTIIDIYSAKGACMLFKKRVLDKILVNNELFDSRYFAYFEETDMCHRVWLAGYSIKFCPDSVIFHKMGGTSTRLNNAFVQFHSFKNRINSYLKNLSILNLIRILPVHLALCEIFALMELLRRNTAMFIAIQRAIVWNIKQLSTTLKKRRVIASNIRKLNDKEIFPIIYKQVNMGYYFHILRLITKNKK